MESVSAERPFCNHIHLLFDLVWRTGEIMRKKFAMEFFNDKVYVL